MATQCTKPVLSLRSGYKTKKDKSLVVFIDLILYSQDNLRTEPSKFFLEIFGNLSFPSPLPIPVGGPHPRGNSVRRGRRLGRHRSTVRLFPNMATVKAKATVSRAKARSPRSSAPLRTSQPLSARGCTPGRAAPEGPRGGFCTAHRAVSPTEPTYAPLGKSVSAFDRVQILAEALPYLQRFADKTIVVKYGGAAMKDPTLKARVVSDVVLLSCVGIRIVMIHGGGPEINKWLDKVGIEPKFHNGLRVTDEATMEIVEAVLAGKVNKSIVSLINKAGGKAVGLCGKDANIISARQTSDKELGFVGDVTGVDPSLIRAIVENNSIPVIASVASDENGQSLNVNADIAAGEIAASLGAEKLILMTDVPGVMEDKDDVGTLYKELDIQTTRGLIDKEVIAGGMIPKVQCCVRSIAQGVQAAHIIDGRQPHSLLQEILTDEGVGTMITET